MTINAAIWIAVYGAILSTLVFVWNIIAWRINRGRIKFDCREVFNYDLVCTCIEYKVINTGEKPVTITQIGHTIGRKKDSSKGEGRFIIEGLPHRLEGHSSFVHFRRAPDIFGTKYPLGTASTLSSVFVEDALGKRYLADHKEVKQLIEKYTNQ